MTQTTLETTARVPAQGLSSRVAAAMSMVKFAHTIFAMPFALVGFAWGLTSDDASTRPWYILLALIILAMVGARTFAMTINRIADRKIDAANPRTHNREIPAGVLSLKFAWGLAVGSVVVFVGACSLLNTQALLLSPLALAVIGGYSLMKRYTALCHLVLGLGLSFAPIGAWVAMTGGEAFGSPDLGETLANAFGQPVSILALGVMFWVAGFDVIYSLQDEEFDRGQGLHSIPVALGKAGGLWLSRLLHLFALSAWAGALLWADAGWLSFAGLGAIGLCLAYEQSLVKPDDLSRVNAAFFTLNGMISVLFAICVLIDVFVLKG